jgi:hypothetical protein
MAIPLLVTNLTPAPILKMFIDCGISFRTSSPALSCTGRIILLPTKSRVGEAAESWKIWILSTWIENLIHHPEDEALLLSPGRKLDGIDKIETDVFIVGAGSS